MKGFDSSLLKIYLLIALFKAASFGANAQFYVGGKLCVSTTIGSTGSDCGSEPTIFFDTNKAATAWSWDFGDPNTTADVATIRNPKYFYSLPGKYLVTLVRTIGSAIQVTDTLTIVIKEPPVQPLFFNKEKGDTTICDGKKLKLDPYGHQLGIAPKDVKFLWFPKGETTQTIEVDSSGCYSVEVFDKTGACSRIAQINIKFCLQETASGGGEKWYFGQGATLNFESLTAPPSPRDSLASSGNLFGAPNPTNTLYVPVSATESNPIRSPEGVAMVYGPAGTLLFYTDGVDIYGNDDELLPAVSPLVDSKLGGTNVATQSAVIIPKNTCNECPHHLYYVYTINKTTGLLAYSIVDTRQNNGKGAVIEKNIPLSIQTSQRITAIKNADETGFFVYSHDAGTNTFRILKIDSTGTTEIIQNIGIVHDDTTSQKGYMRISPTGGKLAIAVSKGGKNYIEVFQIDPKTGRLDTSPRTIDLGVAAPPFVYGVEFSDDEEKLYVTLRGDPTKGETSFLYQLNLRLKDVISIANQKIEIDQSKTLAFGALQSGPTSGTGGKFIYMAINGSQYIPYVQEPNQLGGSSAVGYQPIGNNVGVDIFGKGGLGFPNIIQAKQNQEGESLSATYTGNCQNQPTIFETQGICSPMKGEAVWDFGDGNKGNGLKTSHTYTKTGQYIVKLTFSVYAETLASKNINNPVLGNALRGKCQDFVVIDTLYIKPSPIISLPDSAFVCIVEGKTLQLDPKIQYAYNTEYLWKPTNETNPTIVIGATGNYSLLATNRFPNNTTCEFSDKTEIKEGCEPRLFIPEIFTANKDNINDVLQIPNAHISEFDLRIYNRWGEIVFESKDPEKIWDGSHNGKIIAPMMYAFVVSYKSLYFPYRKKITRSGGIFLMN